ncbi:hypothetical protein POTOM_048936 [Populus tomentosa]|uniref:AAA+ ATPase domain-containing protein n=1 Tax=Populus tomentosa TaxID=118781 RepID=A0A8X7Y9H6_POPTO|nr:hypothetical protein POTOM_048936 [Populus tomentosa]
MRGSSETKFLQELLLYAASAALSCLVLFAGLRQLDPNREASKKALEHKKEIAKRLGRPLIQTNPYEVLCVWIIWSDNGMKVCLNCHVSAKKLNFVSDVGVEVNIAMSDVGGLVAYFRNRDRGIWDVIACDVINPDHIDVEFGSIGGLEAIKQALYELVILPLRRPELFSHGKLLGPQKGVLLYGPPGTGKTMLAKAIARESGAVFINVRISNLMSKWFGDAQKLVAAVFSLAYKLQPAIIFIDEVDSFLGQRRTTDHEALTNMKTEFMALWDGFTTDQNAQVMVLAATNRPSELDEAILRRLPQAFEIGMPDQRERAEILKVVLKGEKIENNIDFNYIASLCEGYTGSDLLELCKKAAYFPIREILDEEKKGKNSSAPRPLSQADLQRVLATSTKTGVAANEYSRCWRSFEDKFCVYQIFKVPQFNDLFQENQLYHKVSTYLTSLPAIEDSDSTNLFSGSKANDIILHLDKNQVIHDSFLGAGVQWSNEKYCEENNGKRTLVLKLRKKDKRTILRPYLQHILSVADQIKQKNEEIKLFMNLEKNPYENGRWTSVPFTHPATMDTMVMDGELKSKVKADLELFLKSKQYYHRLGHVWKRSYLLYGASGTGKSSFIAAMARFLSFDVYDIDMSKVSDDSDLKMLLLQTTSRSMIVIEDLDRLLTEKSKDVSLSGVLNFMDGIVSCCGEERVMVFTMNSKDQIDQSVLRPGRVDVHIQFPLCDFSAFKSLANNYLGVKEHKLFSLVEEILQGGSSLTPAEIGEIMISNRNSPSRALRLVISALQFQTSSGDARRASKAGQGMSESRSARSSRDETGETGGVFCQESGAHTVKELKKLYGLLRMGSRRKESVDLSSSPEKQGSHQEA